MTPRLAAALLALLPAGVLSAQSSGPAFAIAHGFSVDPATPLLGGGPATLFRKATGYDATEPPAPAPPPVPGRPDFSTLFAGVPVDVDAVSIGYDWVLANAAGVVDVPATQWGAITFSVRRASTGLPGSVIRTQSLAADGAAGDVFAYVLPGSNLPPSFVGVTWLSQDSTEISLYSGGPQPNIDAMDVFLGLLYLENPQLGDLLPPLTIYFSVTAATVPAIPMSWTAVPALRSGASVFATTWSPVTASWSTPVVFLTPASLGLASAEDVDALALDLQHGRVLFSTDGALSPLRNQLLYSTLLSVSNVPYTLPGGAPVTSAIGLGALPDDIDGICALDPGDPTQPSQIRLERMLGTISAPLLGTVPTQLQCAVYRRLDPTTLQEQFVTWMSGWPPPGPGTPDLAVVGISIGSPSGPYATGAAFSRPNPASPFFPFQGHPERFRLTIPPAFSLTGVPVFFVWGAFTSSAFDLSCPVGIRL
jgi:hypothetical protein